MKGQTILFAILLSSFSLFTTAQDLGSLMTDLASGLKDEAFNKKWPKSSADWMENAANVSLEDMAGAQNSLKDLLGGLKGSAFETTASALKGQAMKSLLGSMTPNELIGLLGDLVNGIKPSMFKEAFDKEGFLSNLQGLME